MSEGLDAFLSILTFDLDAILRVLDDLFGIRFPVFSDIAEMLDFDNPIESLLDGLRDFAGDFTGLIEDALDMPERMMEKINNVIDKFDIAPDWMDCATSSQGLDGILSCLQRSINLPDAPDPFRYIAFYETLLSDAAIDGFYEVLRRVVGESLQTLCRAH